ncbi:hypothetical protein OPKNFCMD_3907 [Methylobacterium crusticola]|uniref:Uncharacterized protein n=1 Tax=Methylobacterium crusticola TaxID=1697972 RepID=A0ABQ4R1Z1_9HYPH|nr:hypothetical protein [Methylobacterium crusticola]GJD51155.1 hypothetical protein OPKNFCMD_3907 [Methylobacterium crusticola]
MRASLPAKGAALGGLMVLMAQPGPSWHGVCAGAAGLVGFSVLALAARSKPAPARRPQPQPPGPAPAPERPSPFEGLREGALAPGPHASLLMPVAAMTRRPPP